MTHAAMRNRYVGDVAATAAPSTLLVMLFDRLLLDLDRAAAMLHAGEREAAQKQLRHAQDIVIELRANLDVDAWSGAPRLAAIYAFLLSELVRTTVERDLDRSATMAATCRRIVAPLAEAWRAAAVSLATSGTPTLTAAR